ncbi:DNA-directed RNA polymerase subunit delta [Paenibacillus alvei]|uniref:DNA-directed RNA polymerase subunit delta n=1 Tax=Paenibacillus alvei TaxID=44250 RepID=UPI0013D98A71|nr:DNA-directed RNA polymerase subunit delta [Paenibacillus alvei]MBG9732784.1 DNA-directed RNA polymerase subunit delta [Paenibacillus alvei]MBG9744147.1 DNA-directed RNA polymerase subunit delta [Paenibacillus alvei]MCY9580206.1 DNA-directed RNA polymerase subunit delta [Paenibacillus alvei]MCY9588165.1 DNA-directed RNA polymerase subunit delta [Paenibacillus alvei]NEZ43597.1 DNA-directed RNA polymerase subunit delta [Paenibacillus alvei]
MSTPLDLKLDPEKVQEIPMVDLAFMVLKTANTPFYYRDLMNEVAKLRGLSEEQINDVIAQLYTEINIDGRFACVGQNLWGLKRWYPVDRSEEAMAGGTPRPRIINDDDDDDYNDDDDNYHNDEEEDFDFVDEDSDEDEEIFEDDDSDVEDDVDIEEEIDEEDADLNEDEDRDEFEDEEEKDGDM